MSAIAIEGARIAGIEAEHLAACHGTPLYVYDLDVIGKRVDALRATLPPSVELAYAAKANPALDVLGEMCRLELGLDIASGGELLAAQRAGFDASRIVFTGPGKTDAELTAAVAAGLRAITVESAGELARLERLAAAAGRRVPILLRVAVRGEGEATPILAGGWRKFGIDPRQLEAVARAACHSRWVELLGLHAFGASNVRDADVIAGHVARTVELAYDLARRVGLSCGWSMPAGDWASRMSTASSRSTSIDWARASPAWRPAGTLIQTWPSCRSCSSRAATWSVPPAW